MPAPIAYGVHKALDEERRRRDQPPPWSPGRGWGVFVISTVALSWLAVAVLDGIALGDGPVMHRLMWASLYYAATMGWQPVVAAWLAGQWRGGRRPAEAGMHLPRLRDVGIAIAIAVGLAALAMVVARLVGETTRSVEAIPVGADSAAAAMAVMFVLCVQAVTEEYGWRGAPMAYAIERWGPRVGLVVHGIAWGVWYAPLFLISAPTPAESLVPAGGFVVTCAMLGVVFGWLRLRSGSVLPSAIANALLTIVAGLPLLIQAGSAGIRDAVFRWPGWPVIGAVAMVVLLTQQRDLAPKTPD